MPNEIHLQVECSEQDVDLSVEQLREVKAVSPTAIVEEVEGGVQITAHDLNGTTTAFVRDGISPTAAVVKEDDRQTITITDVNGTTSAEVIDGYSPSASVSKDGRIATITITDKQGTTSQDIIDGAVPSFSIGQVSTLDPGSPATASVTGTDEYPVLNLGIPKGDMPELPSDVSYFNNDAGYLTETDLPKDVSYFNNDAGYLTQHQDISGKANTSDLSSVAFSGSYTDLSNTPRIPNPEELLDDKQTASNKTWSANKINNELSTKADQASVPTKVSQLTNDSGYITGYTETDPTVPSWAKASEKPTYTAQEVGAPTVQEMNSAIAAAIGDINSFDLLIVQELPLQDISTHTIYLVPKTGETNDVYDEYVYINNAWEMIGNTQIDLSNYVQKTDYATASTPGVVMASASDGLQMSSSQNGQIMLAPASSAQIKGGIKVNVTNDISKQHESTFYGLAKAAGSDEKDSALPVGQYTSAAKAAIKSMIGVNVEDVQVNETSIVSNGVANIQKASSSNLGVVGIEPQSGVEITSSGKLEINPASTADIKKGEHTNKPIVPFKQDVAAFYGLATAAGDSTQSTSANAVGTYTDEAKAAIQQMLDVPSTSDIPDVPVTDVQINGTSILSDGVANVPVPTDTRLGVMRTWQQRGTIAETAGRVYINAATADQVKAGTEQYRPIAPARQDASTFYGLAKAAGDSTQSTSSNAVGTYTNDAKVAIRNMIGAFGSSNILGNGLYVSQDIETGNVYLGADVEDVQVNGTSVVSNGVAAIPYSSSNSPGVITLGSGLYNDNGKTVVDYGSSSQIKTGTSNIGVPIKRQHEATFYGLAKVAGSDMASSSNAVGTYTDAAKVAIQKMLGIYEPPWELINEGEITKETAGNCIINRDSLNQTFELTSIRLLVWFNTQTPAPSVTGYGGINFMYGGSAVKGVTVSTSSTLDTNGKFAYVDLCQEHGMTKVEIIPYGSIGGSIQMRMLTYVNATSTSYAFSLDPLVFDEVQVRNVTGTMSYRLYGRRKAT